MEGPGQTGLGCNLVGWYVCRRRLRLSLSSVSARIIPKFCKAFSLESSLAYPCASPLPASSLSRTLHTLPALAIHSQSALTHSYSTHTTQQRMHGILPQRQHTLTLPCRSSPALAHRHCSLAGACGARAATVSAVEQVPLLNSFGCWGCFFRECFLKRLTSTEQFELLNRSIT